MGHLVEPDKLPEDLRRVPYLCRTPYDQGDFISYPVRTGWSDEDLRDPSESGRTIPEIESFLQTWLWFGLLHAFFGSFVAEADFTEQLDDGANVCTHLDYGPSLMSMLPPM